MVYLQNKDIEIVLADNKLSRTHTHEFLEIAYVAEGRALHKIKNEEAVICRGNYFIVDYNTEHSYESISDEPLLIVNILFNPRFIDKSLERCRSFDELLRNYLIKFDSGKLKISPTATVFTDDDGKIGECIESLICEFYSKGAGFTEMMRCELLRLILRTMRKISARDDAEDDIVAEICRRVSENPAEVPTLGQIADELSYSQYYLSARFKELSGIGYRDYVAKVRMSEASRLLANTNKKIAQISEEVGYLDVNSFYIAFRKHHGVTPSNYRRQLGKS